MFDFSSMSITVSLTTLKRVLYGFIAVGTVGVVSISFALAQENEVVARIQFPIAELGGCADKQSCKNYCDQDENRRACFAFAKKHGLMKAEKVRKIERQLNALKQSGGGPGGCQSEKACENYCSDISHMKECIEFGKRHGIMESRELEEAEKVLRALESGAKLPGNCRGKAECELYCSVADHMEECIAFAESAGIMDKKELEEAKRIMPLMRSGQTPGGCRSKDQCEAYCSAPDHIDECIAFAEKAGLMKPEELEMMRKTGGRGPGGCRGRVECETYCNNPDNAEVCFAFAKEHSLIPPEELERIEKAGGVELLRQGGPGGCKGKRECEEFCNKPDNQETCFQFAVEKGLIAPEELEKIKVMGGLQGFRGPGGCVGPRECEEYCSKEENREECMRFAPGDRRGPEAGRRDFDDDEEHRERGFDEDEQERFFNELEKARQEGDVEKVQNLERRLHEMRRQGMPPRDEFPGRGEPTEGFIPPPGFGEGAPPHRGEEFEVPPGFVPSGINEITPELKARMMREGGFREFNEGLSDEERFELEEERARFEERQQLLEREQIKKNIDAREEEFRRRAEAKFKQQQEFTRPQKEFRPPEDFVPPSPPPSPTRGEGEFGGFQPPEGFAPPPEGFRPPEGFVPPSPLPSPTGGAGEFRDFPPQSSAPRGNRALARALSFALALIFGR